MVLNLPVCVQGTLVVTSIVVWVRRFVTAPYHSKTRLLVYSIPLVTTVCYVGVAPEAKGYLSFLNALHPFSEFMCVNVCLTGCIL